MEPNELELLKKVLPAEIVVINEHTPQPSLWDESNEWQHRLSNSDTARSVMDLILRTRVEWARKSTEATLQWNLRKLLGVDEEIERRIQLRK